MRMLITGGTGQLGSELVGLLRQRHDCALNAPARRELDLSDSASITRALDVAAPDVVLHCGAYTAVDRAEDEPRLCRAVNSEATATIARWCGERNALMLYISTDYVFPGEGDRFYSVDDATAPLNVYGASKLAGEVAVRDLAARHYIVRVSWVFGKQGGGNFIKTMLRLVQTRDALSVVADQIGSPTYVRDLAPLLVRMVTERAPFGTYHATNEGVCSWADLARETFRLAGLSTTVVPIPTSAYPTRARRPLNSRLDKSSLDAAGLPRLPQWPDAVARFLQELR